MSLLVPAAPHRSARPRDELDEFLSSDLEASFNSSMSLNSPPRSPVLRGLTPSSNNPVYGASLPHVPQHLPIWSPVPMDISPAPGVQRPRSFGRDLVNTVTNEILQRNLLKNTPDKPLGTCKDKPTTTVSGTASNKGRQRSALPTQWLQPSPAPSPVSAMDIDSPVPAPPKRPIDDIGVPQGSRKRRSTEPEPEPEQPSLSDVDAPSSSPSNNRRPRKFERFASSGVVFALPNGNQEPSAAPQEKQQRRPALSALLPASAVQPDTCRPNSYSAYPVISLNDDEVPTPSLCAAPPPRRAFSTLVTAGDLDGLSVPSSDDSFMMSSPAMEYAKRNNQRVLRRRDGREEFRPKSGAGAVQAQMNPSPKMGSEMRPFGAEINGKILPCASVRDDGLMRIEPSTMADLLKGRYDSQIGSFKVFDCRFDYEYAGGHIANAINVNSTAAIEEMLLTPNGFLPDPSSSGDGKSGKVVLIFHCEFSAHRAPVIAKHLRSKDRSTNHLIYPKVHYPEVYILSGGYCQFFQEYPEYCAPRAYVRMDDPLHSKRCDDDIDTFRKGKWGRTRSYTYGEVNSNRSRVSTQICNPAPLQHRNTAPSGGGVDRLFAAANVARTRRAPTAVEDTLATLDEHEPETEPDTSGSVLDGSPCPPAGSNRMSAPMLHRASTLHGF